MKKIIFILLLFLGLYGLIINPKAEVKSLQAGLTQTGYSNLNVRASATTDSRIISSLKNNSYVTIISSKNKFYYVEYGEDLYGYVHQDYIKILADDTRLVNTGGANLNVRTGPSTGYSQFEKIKSEDLVVILENYSDFAKVLFEGNKVGYVAKAYLKELNIKTNEAYSINLNVISYKQYDERWANLTLGKQGGTIKKIGCLTTSVAMAQSYRLKKTITPIDIRSTHNYTSDGSLYWPSDYKFYQGNDYLAKALEILKTGKPVLIGMKTQAGGQHWVVITGYVENANLSADDFIVNDPGSTKTNLSQVLNSYPIFYKLAYY